MRSMSSAIPPSCGAIDARYIAHIENNPNSRRAAGFAASER